MKIEFTYDEVTKQARSSDSEIYVERLGVSREQVHSFCLHWQHRKIVFNAIVAVSGSPPARRHDWTITGVGKISLHVPTYHFTSEAEFDEAIELAEKAMKVMPRSLLPAETPIISVQLSDQLKTAR